MHENWMAFVFSLRGGQEPACMFGSHPGLYEITFDYRVSVAHYSTRYSISAREWELKRTTMLRWWCLLPTWQWVFNAFIRHLLRFCPSPKNSDFCHPDREHANDSVWKNVLTWRRIFDEIELNNNKILSADVEAACWTWAIAIGTFAWRLPLNKYKCFKWNEAH